MMNIQQNDKKNDEKLTCQQNKQNPNAIIKAHNWMGEKKKSKENTSLRASERT